MPVVLFVTGLGAWVNGMYFLGIGARPREGGVDPLKAVGWISLVVGLADFAQLAFIIGEDARLAGLVAFYAFFFVALGIVEILGLDLRVIGNLAVPVAIVPLIYWYNFFTGTWMFRTILIYWAVLFLSITATTYGRMQPKTLGVILAVGAGYTFWVPAAYLALNFTIP